MNCPKCGEAVPYAGHSGWIPCGERLPDKCGYYLVWVNSDGPSPDSPLKVRIEHYTAPGAPKPWYGEPGFSCLRRERKHLTHWMPLPEPPK